MSSLGVNGLILLSALSGVYGLSAWASESDSKGTCGVIESFLGDVQILNSTRSQMEYPTVQTTFKCDSWVNVNQGWARVKYQNGSILHLAEQTLVQFSQLRKGGRLQPDPVILYKGQLFAEVMEGAEEFRVISATGRARLQNGRMIFVTRQNKNETQLIVLKGSATLENRFDATRKVVVQAGEATELDLKLVRVLPLLPSAISLASLRPKLAYLRVSESIQYEAAKAVLKRQQKKYATQYIRSDNPDSPTRKDPEEKENKSPKEASRKLAAEKPYNSYLRNTPDPDDAALRQHWIEKSVGGADVSDRILYPDKSYGSTQRVRVEVEDLTAKRNRKPSQLVEIEDATKQLDQKSQKQEDVEKRRLIEELSRIRME